MKLRVLVVLSLFVAACCSYTTKASRPGATADGGIPVTQPTLPSFPSLPGVPFQFFTSAPSKPAQKVECGAKVCVPTYVMRGSVTSESVQAMIDWMNQAKAGGAKAMVVELDTKGGNVDEGHRLIRHIEDLGVPTHCVADHEAMSQGFAILQACTRRYMTKRTQLMAHQPHVTMMLQGREQDATNIAENMRTVARSHAEQCAARLRISTDEYVRRTEHGKDWFMTWQEAEQVGAVDKVVPGVSHVREALRAGLQP